MITDKLINRRMKLAEVEAQLYELNELRLALINQIRILEEIIQEEKIKKDGDNEGRHDKGTAGKS